VAIWLWAGYGGRVRLTPAEEAPRATALALRDLEGNVVLLESLRGSVVVVNLWADWCGPCRVEMRRLQRLEIALRARGLVVLGVNVEDLGAEALNRVVAERGVGYTIAVPAGPLEGTFEPAGVLPQTWVIDRAGRVRASVLGLVGESGLRRACERLLSEPAP
jgi:thiol-disulfide isomerase/thioredoxin